MYRHLTSQDWERIAEFTKTPEYERQPEILVPNESAVGMGEPDKSELIQDS